MGQVVATGGDPTRVVGRRLIGAVMETIIDVCVFGAVASVLGAPIGTTKAGTLGFTRPTEDASKILVLVAIMGSYVILTKVWTLGVHGWTPGMLLMGLRCVRSDGRPPGVVRALARSLFYLVYQQFGCLFAISVWMPVYFSKTHRGFQDMLVGTYVIDGMFKGRLLIPEVGATGKVYVGPLSVTRQEAEDYQRAVAAAAGGGAAEAAGFHVPIMTSAIKRGQPYLDRSLDTYVVWNSTREMWLAFDKTSNTWYRVG